MKWRKSNKKECFGIFLIAVWKLIFGIFRGFMALHNATEKKETKVL